MQGLSEQMSFVDSQNLLEQWKIFQKGDEVDHAVISEKVHNSWARSRALNVDPHARTKKYVSPEDMQKVFQENADLIDCSKNIMTKLLKSVSAADSVISLADKNGVILNVSFQQKYMHVLPGHSVGDIFTEEVCGTNGIGTCLAEVCPIELVGAEHYCAEDHAWYCSSAPIFDNHTNMVGVFNISVHREGFRHPTGGMAEAAAFAITEQLALREMLKEQNAILDLLNEGVIVTNNDGDITAANKKACDLLQLAHPPIGRRLLHILHAHEALNMALKQRKGFTDEEIEMTLASGAVTYLLSAVGIPNKGVVFSLRDRPAGRECGRAVGARASYTFDSIVGTSEALQAVVRQARKAGESSISTLILGESGTGKELFAQAVHNASPRSNGPFVAVNCGAIPHNLVQSELFGYEEGAFTGASRFGKAGKFELADGGTIFLDEIGEMPLEAQVSLLRLLQNGEILRVGAKKCRYADMRIIAATNKDLALAVARKQFREDLYFRLNAFTLNLPPLRNRRDDVVLLAQAFLKKYAQRNRKHLEGFTEETVDLLRRYPWPGNVRELENYIERAVTVAESALLRPEDFPEHLGTVETLSTEDFGMLRKSEMQSVRAALGDTCGNIRKAALVLGISRSTLYHKMRNFGIDSKAFKGRGGGEATS